MADQQFIPQDPSQVQNQAVPSQNTGPFWGPFGGTISQDTQGANPLQDIPLPPLGEDFSLDLGSEASPFASTQIEPIQTVDTAPSVQTSIPVAVEKEIQAPVNPIPTPMPKPVEPTQVVPQTPTNNTPEKEPSQAVYSEVRTKFNELKDLLHKTYQLNKLDNADILDLIWANNDKLNVVYQFHGNEPDAILIERIELTKETEEEEQNIVSFSLNKTSQMLNVFLDDVLLFEEEELLHDAKKKLLVLEKMNKFIFLLGEESKKIEREIKAREEEEQERKRLQDVFRNF